MTAPTGQRRSTFGHLQAANLAEHFSHELLTGAQADRKHLARLLNGSTGDQRPADRLEITSLAPVESPEILHLASHGIFDIDDPMTSGFELADGRFTAADVLETRLTGMLAVLGACETGVALVRTGDELLGLVRALLYAGASCVIVSLWKVDELSTTLLFREFYRFLGAGQPAAIALGNAQRWLRDCTAGDVIALTESARSGADPPVAARIAIAEARIRLLACDFEGAERLARAALDDGADEADRSAAEVVLHRARFLAGSGRAIDVDKRVYQHYFHWAPFITVGDWF